MHQVKAFLILDTEGERILAKYTCSPPLPPPSPPPYSQSRSDTTPATRCQQFLPSGTAAARKTPCINRPQLSLLSLSVISSANFTSKLEKQAASGALPPHSALQHVVLLLLCSRVMRVQSARERHTHHGRFLLHPQVLTPPSAPPPLSPPAPGLPPIAISLSSSPKASLALLPCPPVFVVSVT